MAGREVLVGLKHADGTAGVVREARRLWLTGDVDRGASTGLDDYQPAIEGLPGERTVQGGRLPPGAVTGEIVDDAGDRPSVEAANGAWVVVLDQATSGLISPVRFLDADGRTVARPLPTRWHRSPANDALEACPACAAWQWDEVRPLDGSRGNRGVGRGRWKPTPIVVCRVCGHEESMGLSVGIGSSTPETTDLDAIAAEWELELADQKRAALRDLDFPVFVALGRPGTVSEWSRHGRGKTTAVTVRHEVAPPPHPVLHVRTDREQYSYESETALARDALLQLHYAESTTPHRSDAGATIWLHTRRRALRLVAATAIITESIIALDAETAMFKVAATGSSWAAVRRHDTLLITVTARGIPLNAVALTTLSNLISGN